jgi:PPK2 family polyphosphate:nucleotide phosphotransferase
LAEQLLVPPVGKKVRLKEYDPGYTGKFKDKQEVKDALKADQERLAELQDVLYADSRYALLIVLQGMDTGGKDGAIEHVFKSVNPQGVDVTAFKQPTPIELTHDFLWRAHLAAPAKGYIGIFNRSHYEDVLVVRVHDLVPKKVWKPRYDYINQFEALLSGNNTVILKFFLYISKDEQKERLQDRLDDPNKQWKFALGDLKERELWDDYIEAYEDALTQCNTEYAPWHIVPANHKWYRNYVVIRTIIETLETMDLRYPPPKDDLSNVTIPD